MASIEKPNEKSDALPARASVLTLLLALAQNGRLLLFGTLSAGLLAFAATFLLSPTYTATTSILPPQPQASSAMLASQLGALASVLGSSAPLRNPSDLYVALLESRSIADRLIDRFDLRSVYGEDTREEARKELAKATLTRASKRGLITIEVDDHDPKRAADLANAYVQELTEINRGLAVTEAQYRRIFFEKQLEKAQESLKRAEIALTTVGASQAVINAAPQAVIERVARLKAQVTAQEIRVSTMDAFLTPSNPEMQLARRQLASLQEQLRQAEQRNPTKPGDPDYLNRYRDFKYQETLFELLAKQLELARIDEAREGAIIQVVDVAIPPERKSKPRRAIITAVAMFLAGVLLFAFVAIRDAVHRIEMHPEYQIELRKLLQALKQIARRK